MLFPEYIEWGQPKLNVHHKMVDVTDTGCYGQEMSQVDKEGNVVCSLKQSGLRSTVFYVLPCDKTCM
jgi:hypothetical protein